MLLLLSAYCPDAVIIWTESMIRLSTTRWPLLPMNVQAKFLVNAYRYLPDGFNRIGSEAMLDAATDDAEHANASCNIQHFNTGESPTAP